MNIRSGRCRRAVQAMDAEVGGRPAVPLRAGSAERVPGCPGAMSCRRPRCARPPRRRPPAQSRSGSPGHGTIECRQSPPPPGSQEDRVGCSQSARLSSHVRAAVAALEQHAGVTSCVQRPVALAGDDHPYSLERRVATLGQRDAVRLAPLARKDHPRTRSSARRSGRSWTRTAGRCEGRASRTRPAPRRTPVPSPRSRRPARPRARTDPCGFRREAPSYVSHPSRDCGQGPRSGRRDRPMCPRSRARRSRRR